MSDTTPLQNAPNSYLYGEYADDPDIKATRDAYYAQAQGLFSWLQNNPIADYRNDPISSQLLDFVGAGLYNMTRNVPVVGTGGSYKGAFADVTFSEVAFAGGTYTAGSSTTIVLTDDQFRRSITWNIYTGDGWTFSTPWLRRRLARFIFSANGYDIATVDQQQLVSIEWPQLRTANITIASSMPDLITLLQNGLGNGYLKVPIGYTFNIAAA